MKIYFLIIPLIIGISFGGIMNMNLTETSQNSTILNKENLLRGSTILGNENAKITVVEFGDYQCTFCYKFHENELSEIYQKHVITGNVNFIFKDFPLNGEPSIRAAEASYCAQKQEKFWQYHNTLFHNWNGENTGWITENALRTFAIDSGLDEQAFDECMNNSEFRQKVLDNEEFGRQNEINATLSNSLFSRNRHVLGGNN